MPAAKKPPVKPPEGIAVDGKFYTDRDLTYGEQQELRDMIRVSTGNPDAGLAGAPDMDLIPGVVFLVRRRSNDGYTYEQACQITEVQYDEMAAAALEAVKAGPTK